MPAYDSDDDAPLQTIAPAQHSHGSLDRSRPSIPKKFEVPGGISLINAIEQKQGIYVGHNEPINKTKFGQNGQPLVPLTARDIANVPGVDIHKFRSAASTKQEATATRAPAYPRCATCGCLDFAPHHFRKNSCANCFHTH
jgi:hypothetical protein